MSLGTMVSAPGNNSRSSGTLHNPLKRKFKRRRRRRRSKKRGKVSMLSAFIGPFRYFNTGEDEDRFSTSSVEVKENRDIGNIEDCAIGPRHHQSFLLSDMPGGGNSCLKRKRPLEEENVGPLCTVVHGKLSWCVSQKNALVQLNELKPGLRFDMVSQTGPVHAPVFAMRVEVNGLTFEGRGPTKKKAKMRAAELALGSFIQFPNACQAHLALGSGGDPTADFTSDQAGFPDTLFKEFEPLSHGDSLPCCRPATEEMHPAATATRCRGRLVCHTLDLRRVRAKPGWCVTAFPAERDKTPVGLLNELRPGL
ncbi:hypothetical protein AAFF_G00245240, partial [Aldrovandia affinis]